MPGDLCDPAMESQSASAEAMSRNLLIRTTVRFLSWLAVLACPSAMTVADESTEDRVRFSRDVLPILSDRCFLCHGPDEGTRQADLRLDREDTAKEYAILPGDAESSAVVSRIFADDPDLRMPPPDSKLTLSAEEKSLIRRWIEQGAEWDQHWAFQPIPPQVPVPDVDHTEWVVNDIDRFVLRRLEEDDLRPQAEATKAAYIRRVTFDLTGLPPTAEEIDAWIADDAPGARERLVDRLLASPRFGERMAADWLDVARYADTYGYQNDRYREMWPWRDWVVSAFNDNLPWDEFVTWQLAGDLLPGPTRDQVLATAFNRNHRQTNEGGSIEDEFRKEYVADRVNTFGAAFLGLTLECARCHDHKYDPVTQREYYQLAAFFNSIDESGLYSHFTDAVPTPTLSLATSEEQQRIEAAQAAVAAAERKCNAIRTAVTAKLDRNSLQAALLQISVDRGLIGHFPLESLADNRVTNAVVADQSGGASNDPQVVSGRIGNGVRLSGDNTLTVPAGGTFTRDDPFSVSLWVQAADRFERAVVFHRSRAWTDSGSQGYELLIEDGRLSAALIHFWPGNAIRIRSRAELPVGEWQQVTMTYDGSSRAAGLRLYVNGQLAECEVVRDHLTKSINGGVKELAVGERFRDVGLRDSLVDELRVFDVQLTGLEVAALFTADTRAADASAADTRAAGSSEVPSRTIATDEQAVDDLLDCYLHVHSAEYQAALAELRESRVARSRATDPVRAIMVMRELPEPRPTYVLTRGAYDAPAERVERQTPAALSLMSESMRADRLGLSRWLTRPDHPLTARVAVNRFWQMMFGRGLVVTAEDFGRQGAPPSHPELLDHLARSFIDSGWDVKHLLRTMALSATYGQDSDCSPELRQGDPENVLLARGPVQRLTAEMLRDAVLAASGLLVEKRGGPPVKPWQPPGLWEEKSGVAYQRDAGEGSRRRSLYTYWKRTSQPPSMMTFDASNREVCVVKRQVTHTPLQVLVLWNDPQFVEAACALGEQALKEHPADVGEQVRFVFRRLTGRHATDAEVEILQRLHTEQLAEFTSGRCDAGSLLTVGDHRIADDLDPNHVAALALVAQAVMSHDAFLMKR